MAYERARGGHDTRRASRIEERNSRGVREEGGGATGFVERGVGVGCQVNVDFSTPAMLSRNSN